MRKGRKIYHKYKLVAETPHSSFVYRSSDDKQKLEDLAVRVSPTKPNWKFLVVPSSFIL